MNEVQNWDNATLASLVSQCNHRSDKAIEMSEKAIRQVSEHLMVCSKVAINLNATATSICQHLTSMDSMMTNLQQDNRETKSVLRTQANYNREMLKKESEILNLNNDVKRLTLEKLDAVNKRDIILRDKNDLWVQLQTERALAQANVQCSEMKCTALLSFVKILKRDCFDTYLYVISVLEEDAGNLVESLVRDP